MVDQKQDTHPGLEGLSYVELQPITYEMLKPYANEVYLCLFCGLGFKDDVGLLTVITVPRLNIGNILIQHLQSCQSTQLYCAFAVA